MKVVNWILFFGAIGGIMLCNAKGEAMTNGSTKKDIKSERPYRELVSKLSKEVLTKRADEYVQIAKDLDYSRKYSADDRTNLHTFVEELVVQQDYPGIELLEARLENPWAKKAIWTVLLKSDGKEAKRLLRKWALENPSRPELLGYHPDGITLLLQIIEDTEAPIADRVTSMRVIAQVGNIDLLPNLRRWENDRTQVSEASAKTARTLGDIAGECIRTLELRQKEKEDRGETKLRP